MIRASHRMSPQLLAPCPSPSTRFALRLAQLLLVILLGLGSGVLMANADSANEPLSQISAVLGH